MTPPAGASVDGQVVGLHLHGCHRTREAQAAARRALGRRFGLVTACRGLPSQPNLPRLSVFVAHGGPRAAWGDFPTFRERPGGTGVSSDPEDARLAAVAEVVERYTAFVCAPSPSESVRASFDDVGDVAVSPEAFAQLSPRQYRRFPQLRPLSEANTIDWCWSYSLTRGRGALIPTALVYPRRGRAATGDLVAGLSSTGVACDVSIAHGLLAALCEVLERDALAVAWHGRIPLVALDPTATAAQELITGPLAACSHRFSLFQVPTDLPFPVVLAVAWNPDREPHVATGAACRPDPVDAATKALLEASQMLWRLRGQDAGPPQRIRRFDDHARFFAMRQGADLLRSQLERAAGPRRLVSGDGACSAARELDRGVRALADLGLDVLTVELTTADVAATGFRVYRVLVPGTIETAADPRLTKLGGRRLYELGVRLGVRERPLRESELNLLPAPLG